MKQEEYSWLSITENRNSNYLDFSVNTNSLGVPNLIRKNLSHLINAIGFYPDTNCSTLSAALAENTRFHIIVSFAGMEPMICFTVWSLH